MDMVQVSTKYLVVIPKKVREQFALKPGQKMRIISYNDRIELIPEKPIKEARGFIKDIDATVKRERDRL